MYEHTLKPIFFRFDPEKVHDFMVFSGNLFGKFKIGKWIIGLMYGYKGKDISKTVDGIKYSTPFILSAGFDYNAELMNILPCIGLSGEEIGSVTARPCEGNPKPRLTRLPKSQSILVNKGLRNDGVDVIIDRLKRYKIGSPILRSGALYFFTQQNTIARKNKVSLPVGSHDFVIGISIARTNDDKSISVEDGIEDYVYSFKRLNEENIGDYYTINISCPNAFGGESFSEPAFLERLLQSLKKIPCTRPLYVKMPINLPWEKFNQLLGIIDRNGLNGVVIGNLNKNYNDLDVRSEAPDEYYGGLSGKPCRKLSTELIRKTREMYGKRFTIIGCGGVMSAEDAQEKIDAGADLIQLISGLIYKGPGLVKKMCKGYSNSQN